jgi:hypothetical protein
MHLAQISRRRISLNSGSGINFRRTPLTNFSIDDGEKKSQREKKNCEFPKLLLQKRENVENFCKFLKILNGSKVLIISEIDQKIYQNVGNSLRHCVPFPSAESGSTFLAPWLPIHLLKATSLLLPASSSSFLLGPPSPRSSLLYSTRSPSSLPPSSLLLFPLPRHTTISLCNSFANFGIKTFNK